MNWKGISRNVGYALLVSALFMLFSIFVSLLNGNDSALAALIISFTITFIVGIFPFIFVRSTSAISLKEGYIIIMLSWLLSFVFGMLPYALWGGPFSLTNAWFESVSGFTTTGSTILEDVESLPKSLLFWRSSTHFIGGLGVVVFLLLIIPGSNQMKLRLTNMELSSLSKNTYGSNANKTVYIFAYVYLLLFIVSFFSYWIAGMSAFDAVCRHYLHWNQCARFMDGMKIEQRTEEVKRLVKDFRADGIIYENMKFCEFWSYEKVLQNHIFTNELHIPCCTIEKEYALGAVGQLRTRFQAFIESLEIKQIQGGK
jgi:hypothetical protein